MNNRLVSLIVVISLCVTAAQIAQAGYILNGWEWEVRGTQATWAEQQTQAAADSGWMWATRDDWLASGLDSQMLLDPDWSALMGALNDTTVYASSWLADQPPTQLDLAYYLIPNGRADDTQGSFDNSANPVTYSKYRMSYRNTSVPEPTALALLSVGLAGLGFTRRRMKV